MRRPKPNSAFVGTIRDKSDPLPKGHDVWVESCGSCNSGIFPLSEGHVVPAGTIDGYPTNTDLEVFVCKKCGENW